MARAMLNQLDAQLRYIILLLL